ncbi:DUF6455 family protein [Microbaculum marinum]|uniref:DUF6455 family protein n=1 Tax=Microbaculum marinum TaxID=1764581 RepID=A0AAW9RSM1_9HYPH
MFERLQKNRERHAKLMGEMMRRFGVLESGDMSMTGAVNLERAARTCLGCGSAGDCGRWMAQTDGPAGAEAFCPNARIFAELAA